MATTTTNYGLTKPAGTEKYDISVFNANADKIDAQMKANATAASGAKSTADNALSTANTAKTNAVSAQSTANEAKTNASTAQTTANEAQTKAIEAYNLAETKQKAITVSTTEPTASDGANGDLWAVYE